MIRDTFTIEHAVGLHARPAARFVKLCKGFVSRIEVRNLSRQTEPVDAKSLVRVIKIAAAQGQEVEVVCEGADEGDAMEAIREFLTNVPEEDR